MNSKYPLKNQGRQSSLDSNGQVEENENSEFQIIEYRAVKFSITFHYMN